MEREAYLEMAATEDRHWWFEGRRRILGAILRGELRGRGNPEILEIGAGTGGNLRWLSQFGSVKATEMDASAREIARGKSGIEVAAGSLPDDLPLFGNAFDLVVLLDVLEHVDEDVEALRRIGSLLGNNGRLLLTVPAYPWLWSSHDAMLHHRRRYTRKSLERCIGEAGLRTIRMSHFNAALLPIVVIARLIGKAFELRRAPGTRLPSPLVNALLTRVFSAERHFLRLGDLPAGVSILAVVGAGVAGRGSVNEPSR